MAPFWKRITQPIPDPKGMGVIWIHGVSVGEIKSSQNLFRALKTQYPQAFFLITTTTTTGQAEAQRSLPEADHICYLPIDFPWLVHSWARKLRPKLFLLIESDFWPFLLRAIRRFGGQNILVSGRLSARSAKRFHTLAPLSRKLFSLFDLLCVQTKEYYDLFRPLVSPSHLHITGNLKLDLQPQSVNIPYWRSRLGTPEDAIAITCTHPGEEKLLLDALAPSHPFLFLAPRHPERFSEIVHLLTERNIPFYRFSAPEKRTGEERVLLIDTMGQLHICYSLSRLAIVGGSFTPIGGHNILEPCLYDLPTLFGPHMHRQAELTSLLLASGAGLQVSLQELSSAVHTLLSDPNSHRQMSQAAIHLCHSTGGVLQETMKKLLGLNALAC